MGAALSFDVQVVDGEGMSVPGLEVGARYRYPVDPRTWSSSVTNGEGIAHFCDEHPQPPLDVCLYVGDENCATHDLTPDANFTLEL